MATFRKRGDRWQARIRKAGRQAITKTFKTLERARAWARDIEEQIDTGAALPRSNRFSVAHLIRHYRKLRDASRPILDTANEHYMLNHLEAFLGDKTALVPQDLVDYASWRKKEGAGPYSHATRTFIPAS